MHDVILPGGTIGIFGSGQLGRMLALSARQMGYRVHTFSPDSDSPTGQVADVEVVADYADLDAIRRFVAAVDVVTFEFENVQAIVAEIAAEASVPVRPGGWVLHTAQNRLREKTFFVESQLPVTPFAHVRTQGELETAIGKLGTPSVLKTAAFGYDGKGQFKIERPEQATEAWQATGGGETSFDAILEAFVPFEKEVSVVAARGLDGSFAHYGVIENIHRNHILDISIAPARVSPKVVRKAIDLAHIVLEKLDVVGVLCVEFFLTSDENLLLNEVAPRPHNSGHLTVDAAITSQFEQQLRAICGLPLGATDLMQPAVMVNLLGDLWLTEAQLIEGQFTAPNWSALCALPNCHLHLYGKREARIGRKMGHLTVMATDVDQALGVAMQVQDILNNIQ